MRVTGYGMGGKKGLSVIGYRGREKRDTRWEMGGGEEAAPPLRGEPQLQKPG